MTVLRFSEPDGNRRTGKTGSNKYPVVLDRSAGGDGLAPISCVGCHGRGEDAKNDNMSAGRGAGLRQHHTNAGETDCTDCHTDASPANYTPVAENVPPSYYFTPDANHPAKPTGPCNPNGGENFAGSASGLDNDGNDLYLGDDPSCAPAPDLKDVDDDGDGVTENQGDCDDTAASIFPGHPCPDPSGQSSCQSSNSPRTRGPLT